MLFIDTTLALVVVAIRRRPVGLGSTRTLAFQCSITARGIGA